MNSQVSLSCLGKAASSRSTVKVSVDSLAILDEIAFDIRAFCKEA